MMADSATLEQYGAQHFGSDLEMSIVCWQLEITHVCGSLPSRSGASDASLSPNAGIVGFLQ
jgi:hypothetical protein